MTFKSEYHLFSKFTKRFIIVFISGGNAVFSFFAPGLCRDFWIAKLRS